MKQGHFRYLVNYPDNHHDDVHEVRINYPEPDTCEVKNEHFHITWNLTRLTIIHLESNLHFRFTENQGSIDISADGKCFSAPLTITELHLTAKSFKVDFKLEAETQIEGELLDE